MASLDLIALRLSLFFDFRKRVARVNDTGFFQGAVRTSAPLQRGLGTVEAESSVKAALPFSIWKYVGGAGRGLG